MIVFSCINHKLEANFSSQNFGITTTTFTFLLALSFWDFEFKSVGMVLTIPCMMSIPASSHQDSESKDLVIVVNNCPVVELRDEECDDSGCVIGVNSSLEISRVIQNKQDEVISVGVLRISHNGIKYTDASIIIQTMELPSLCPCV